MSKVCKEINGSCSKVVLIVDVNKELLLVSLHKHI